jgi:putative ABC transport system ATP-binding protein
MAELAVAPRPAHTGTPVIELSGAGKTYRTGTLEFEALRGIDLRISEGEYVAIMGPSGSGKSTLLNLLGLLDRPSAGRYWLDDVEVSELSEVERAALRRDRIGFIFQFFHLIPRMTAAQNIELPLILAGRPPAQRTQRVAEALSAFGLAKRADHRPEELSGGERQRVAIARAMSLEPGVLLADEPTGNLDRATGHEVVELIESLWRGGLTLLVVTHDPELGSRARRRLRLEDGRVVQDLK